MNSIVHRNVALNEVTHSFADHLSGVRLVVGLAEIFKHFSYFLTHVGSERQLQANSHCQNLVYIDAH